MTDQYDMPHGDGSSNPEYAMPTGTPQPQQASMVPVGNQAAGEMQLFHGTIVATINLEVEARSPAEAAKLGIQKAQGVMDRIKLVPGFFPRRVRFVDPQTGIAAEAFIDNLQ